MNYKNWRKTFCRNRIRFEKMSGITFDPCVVGVIFNSNRVCQMDKRWNIIAWRMFWKQKIIRKFVSL